MTDHLDSPAASLPGFAPVALATAAGYGLMAALAAALAAGAAFLVDTTITVALICAMGAAIGWLLGCEITRKRLEEGGLSIKISTLRVVSIIGVITGAIAALALASLILATGQSSGEDAGSLLGLGSAPAWEIVAMVLIPSAVAVAITALIIYREVRPPKLSYTVVFSAEEPVAEEESEEKPMRRSPALINRQAAQVIAAAGRAWQQLQPVFADPANTQPDLGDLHALSLDADGLLEELSADRHPDNEWVYATLYHVAQPLHAMAWAASYDDQAAAFADLDAICWQIAGDERARSWVSANS